VDDNKGRSFSTKRGEYTARIHAEKFPERGEQPLLKKMKSDRKFNIRIKQDDIHLFDALAKKEGVTRSALINDILHEIVLDELMSIEEQDARTFLAHFVDQYASYDPLAQPWAHDALGPAFRFILKNVLEGSDAMSGQQPDLSVPAGYKMTEEEYRTPTFLGLRNKLKGIME